MRVEPVEEERGDGPHRDPAHSAGHQGAVSGVRRRRGGGLTPRAAFANPVPLAAAPVRVPLLSASLLNRSRHSRNGKAGCDGRLPNPVDRRRLQSVIRLSYSHPANAPSASQTVLPKPLHSVYEDVVAALAMANLCKSHVVQLVNYQIASAS